MSIPVKIIGLSLKVGPLGENDRLLTLLSEEEGISRFAIPGARKPKSKLAAAVPFTLMEIQTPRKKGLKRVRQIKIIKSYSRLGEKLETLAAAQSIAELLMLIVNQNDPKTKTLSTTVMHLERLDNYKVSKSNEIILAICLQALIHLLSLGGYELPSNRSYINGENIIPPIGNWDWKCYFNPSLGFSLYKENSESIDLNASEIALIQRLGNLNLPLKKNGALMGPIYVWLKILDIIEKWIECNLERQILSLKMLKNIIN